VIIASRDDAQLMRDLLILGNYLFVTLEKFLRPGGVCAGAAKALLLTQQIIISNRPRHCARNLAALGRFVLGLITVFVNPRRVQSVPQS
jgi:hypothetical protein